MIRSLLSYPCGFRIKTIIATLPDKLKGELDQETWRFYVAGGLQALSGIKTSYSDIIDPKPVDNRTGDEVAADVINQIIGGEENGKNTL